MNDLRGFLIWVATYASPALVALLQRLRTQFPDLAAIIDKLLLGISEGLAPEHIADAVLSLPDEALAAIRLEFNPRFHPGDLA